MTVCRSARSRPRNRPGSAASREAWGLAAPRTGIYYYRLPESVGKETESRTTGFVAKFCKLVQVEVDALPADVLPPDVLRGLFDDAIQGYSDTSTYEAVMAREPDKTKVLHRQHQWVCCMDR